MLIDFVSHYWWWVLALLLLIAEVLAPGFFMLWIGVAAALVGFVTLLLPELSGMAQAGLFVLFSAGTCYVYWYVLRPRFDKRSDQPLLNRRGASMVGQRYILDSAIINGRGKARVGDSYWLVEGPDLPVGTSIEVVAVSGTTLQVQVARS